MSGAPKSHWFIIIPLNYFLGGYPYVLRQLQMYHGQHMGHGSSSWFQIPILYDLLPQKFYPVSDYIPWYIPFRPVTHDIPTKIGWWNAMETGRIILHQPYQLSHLWMIPPIHRNCKWNYQTTPLFTLFILKTPIVWSQSQFHKVKAPLLLSKANQC